MPETPKANVFTSFATWATRLTILLPTLCTHADAPLLSVTSEKDAFSLTDCSIDYDREDFTVVAKTADLLASDMEMVTGIRPSVHDGKRTGNLLVLGTLGHSALVDALVANGKLDVSAIKDGWEQFLIRRVTNPFPDVPHALVIAGSDRRGTAYGAFTLSQEMGVSPWVWWADVPVKRQQNLYVTGGMTSRPPSVKYRGIFINDEDWGLQPWAAKNYETELGDIGPKTYARVCELLLRLKGNMFAPAMHDCTGAFYSYPESKKVADDYGIIVTTSHCEPLLFNNAATSEWTTSRDGEWDYAINKDTILSKLNDRVEETAAYENIYTMGMRGLHDEGMRGNHPIDKRVQILEQVMADQRDILRKHLGKPVETLPQIFVPYKETMALYERGLKVPDDITLVWVDDNYGYIRRLSSPQEQQRSGGAGVYYHTSYLGSPHDYLWLCTTPPVLMFEELHKAYSVGAKHYWLLNIGDIKPAELDMQTFFEMAWDMDKHDIRSINCHQSQLLANIFGEQYRNTFQDILDSHYRLAWSRKPEYMGWEREWDHPPYNTMRNTEYSFQNYNDARQRLADYEHIAQLTRQIHKELPEAYRASFFQLLAYPVQGASLMNRKFLLAQLSNELAEKGELASANWAAKEAGLAFDALNDLTGQYNSLLDGKWDGMMSIPPGFCALYHDMPKVAYAEEHGYTPVDITPQADQNTLERCTVIDLGQFSKISSPKGHTLRVIEGIGYDWASLQLGEATQEPTDPTNPGGTRVEYTFSGVDSDHVTVHIYSLPTFPLHDGRSTRFGISVDGQPAIISENNPAEYSLPWKDQVLRNGAILVATFPVEREKDTHTLSIICGDPGMIIQRVIVDWGGLKNSYVGPSSTLGQPPATME